MAKFYICRRCGNLAGMVRDSGVPMVCCGQKMEELVPNTVEASGEKHLPVVTVEDGALNVNIGSVDQYHVDGVSDYDNGRLSEYLGCIDESDRALAEFLDELRELDRPVVVVFFGDHQPALSSIVNDALYPDESDELAHNLRTHETTYLVWANYDVAGSGQGADQEETSPAYLGALVAEAIGAPLTDFQKAQLVVREEIPAMSLVGVMSADGAWIAPDEEDSLPSAFRDLAQISYLEFASKLE